MELTGEQVKAALTSLISIHEQGKLGQSSKRPRTKSSSHRSIDNPVKKHKHQQIYHQTLPSQLTQPETIVLAASGLTRSQMVGSTVLILFLPTPPLSLAP